MTFTSGYNRRTKVITKFGWQSLSWCATWQTRVYCSSLNTRVSCSLQSTPGDIVGRVGVVRLLSSVQILQGCSALDSTGVFRPRFSTGAFRPRFSTGVFRPRFSTGVFRPRSSSGVFHPIELSRFYYIGGNIAQALSKNIVLLFLSDQTIYVDLATLHSGSL